MTPQKLRELKGVSDVACATMMGISLRGLRRLESLPLWAWTITQLVQHCAACGYTLRVLATDAHGVEREVA
jgi:hypothetical protein